MPRAAALILCLLANASTARAQTAPDDGARIGVELGVGLLPGVAGIGASLAHWSAADARCRRDTGLGALGCGIGAASTSWLIGLSLTAVLTPVAVGIGHVAMGGRADVGWMLLGALVGLVVGGGIAGLVYAAETNVEGAVAGGALMQLAYVAALTVPLEISHGDNAAAD